LGLPPPPKGSWRQSVCTPWAVTAVGAAIAANHVLKCKFAAMVTVEEFSAAVKKLMAAMAPGVCTDHPPEPLERWAGPCPPHPSTPIPKTRGLDAPTGAQLVRNDQSIDLLHCNEGATAPCIDMHTLSWSLPIGQAAAAEPWPPFAPPLKKSARLRVTPCTVFQTANTCLNITISTCPISIYILHVVVT
jgi:hypothetical protein